MTDIKQRVIKFVDIDHETHCWNWSGCVQSNGYGRVTYKRKTMGAHRLSYIAFNGEITDGLHVCHRCDNRRCVNPLHLFLGTRLENMADAKNKDRMATGDKLPQTKIHGDDLDEVMRLVNTGLSFRVIGEKFNVCQHTIGCIARKNGVKRRCSTNVVS